MRERDKDGLIYPDGTHVSSRDIKRKRLAEASEGRDLVETVKGFGYRYAGREA